MEQIKEIMTNMHGSLGGDTIMLILFWFVTALVLTLLRMMVVKVMEWRSKR